MSEIADAARALRVTFDRAFAEPAATPAPARSDSSPFASAANRARSPSATSAGCTSIGESRRCRRRSRGSSASLASAA